MNKITATHITTDSITVIVGAKSYCVRRGQSNFDALEAAMKSQDESQILAVLTPAKKIQTESKGRVTISGNDVLFDGEVVHNSLTRRIIAMFNQGFGVKPLMNLLDNMMRNPSYDARNRLYDFLEATCLPVTKDGHFIAYKIVRNDYKDCHTGTIVNSVGAVVEMDRSLVDDNPNNVCSAGLHVCSEGYLPHYGSSCGRVMLCKVNPADVVTVPIDYNNAKMRVCRYEVVDEMEKTYTEDTGFVTDSYSDDFEDDDDLLDGDDLDQFDEELDCIEDEPEGVDDWELTNTLPHNASLTPAQVRTIRRLAGNGATTDQIRTAVPHASPRTIRRVITGEAYKTVV